MSQPCCKKVYGANLLRGRQCWKKAKQAPDGNWYCAVHNPEAIAKRREKSNAKIDAWLNEQKEKRKAQQENARRLALFDELVSMLKPDLLESIILDLDTAMSESNARALSQYIADLKSVKARAIQ